MDPLNLKKLNEAKCSRQAVILLTELESGKDRVIHEGEPVGGELGDAVEKAFRTGKSRVIATGGIECFLNVYVPPPRIVIIGAVHISQAMAPMAKMTGFDVRIIDPRTAFATPERFAGFDLHAEWPQEVLEKEPLDAYCALAAVTHDPKIDDPALIAAIQANCFYIGALGSRKTHGKRRDRLLDAGLSEPEIERIAAPIGLDIGASTPAEIAVAVLAQIISALRKRELMAAAAVEEERMLDA